MGHLRVASRVDRNQASIVRAMRAVGASVLHTHQLKNAFDLLVGYRKRTFLMEIKFSEQDELTTGESEFHRTWQGTPVHIVYTADQAIRIITTAP
jgi:hypothetical protein